MVKINVRNFNSNNNGENKKETNDFKYMSNYIKNENYLKEVKDGMYEVEVVDVFFKGRKSNKTEKFYGYKEEYKDLNEEYFYVVLKIKESDLCESIYYNKFVVCSFEFIADFEKFYNENNILEDWKKKKLEKKIDYQERRLHKIANFLKIKDNDIEIESYNVIKLLKENKDYTLSLKMDYEYKNASNQSKEYIHYPMYISYITDVKTNEIDEEIEKIDELLESEANQVSQNNEKVENEAHQVSKKGELIENETHQVLEKNDSLASGIFGESESDLDNVEFFDE